MDDKLLFSILTDKQKRDLRQQAYEKLSKALEGAEVTVSTYALDLGDIYDWTDMAYDIMDEIRPEMVKKVGENMRESLGFKKVRTGE